MTISNSLVILRTKLFKITEIKYEMIKITHLIKVLGSETTSEKNKDPNKITVFVFPGGIFSGFKTLSDYCCMH